MLETISAGKLLIDLIVLAYKANVAVLIHGLHGVGKSEILSQAAAVLGVDFIVRDLSLMESPDLVGIPRISEDGRTVYAPPFFLPIKGRGLLVFEEINRSQRYMQSPCLQLLTERTLNDYDLPEGWCVCAAVNDADDGYIVEDLDNALLSRFIEVKIIPDVEEWSAWADRSGLHSKIIEFVQTSPNVFDDPEANPRAWSYASAILTTWEKDASPLNLLRIALSGLVGNKWAQAFVSFYTAGRRPLKPLEILNEYPVYKASLTKWVKDGHMDAVVATVDLLVNFFDTLNTEHRPILDKPSQTANVIAFVSDLPDEVKRHLRHSLEARGLNNEVIKLTRGRRRSGR